MVATPDDKGKSVGVASAARAPSWIYALLAIFATVAAGTAYRMVDTSGQLTAIERERLSLLQEKGRLDNALASARKQVDELKSVQSTAEAEIKKSREDAKAASQQSVLFQERAKALETDLNAARQQLADANKTRGDVESRSVGMERDMSSLKQQITELQQKLTTMQANLQAALDGKAKAEALVQQLRQQLPGQAHPAPQ